MPTWFQNQMQRAFYRKKPLSNQTVKPMLVFLQKNFYMKIIIPYKGLIIVLSKGFNRTMIQLNLLLLIRGDKHR